ncbi:MAG: P-loop NTPase fold protein [Longimicrobiaceae bacterium]
MSIEHSLEGLSLSPSVRRVAESYLEHDEVAPAQVINDLLVQHPDYGEGLARRVRLSNSRGAAPIDELLRDAAELFDPDLHELHTRAAIIGLLVRHPEIWTGDTAPLLAALGREMGDPPVEFLTENGLQQWQRLNPPQTQSTTFAAQVSAAPEAPSKGPAASNRSARKSARQSTAEPTVKVAQQAPDSATPPAASPEQVRTALRALADTPTLAGDSLRFGDYADALVEFIENPETQTPLTIGIDAAWGMGKTSLMYMIRERLDPGSVSAPSWDSGEKPPKFSRFRTVWFNAWKYSREEELWAAFALEILEQTKRRFTFRQRLRTWIFLSRERFDGALFFADMLTALSKSLFLLLLGAVLFITGAIALGEDPKEWLPIAAAIGVSGVYAIGTTAFKYVTAPFNLNISRYIRTPNYAEKIGFFSQFVADLQRVVNAVAGDRKWPLVVFVDDLDRCRPQQVVEIVEAIKLLLETKNCFFVIGMDAQAVAASIEARYRDVSPLLAEDPGGLTLGERFLEKIVQVNFRIPRAEKTVVEGYIGEILAGRPARESADPPKVREAERLIKAEQRAGKELPEAAETVGGKKEVDRRDAEKAEQRIREDSETEAEQVRLAVIEAAPYLENNPRKIKRFINTFRLQALVAQKRGMLADPSEATLLARALIIATRWPDLVEGLIPDRGYVDRLLNAEAMQSKLAENLEEMWDEEEKRLKADLDRFLESPRLKRLVTARELIGLLNAMSKEERGRLADYLVLARTAAPVAAK